MFDDRVLSTIGNMGFLEDLTSAPHPCDLCQVDRTIPEPGHEGVADWEVFGHGLNVKFLICARCKSAIESLELKHKSPLIGITVLVNLGLVSRPPPEAYLNHPEWRKVWRHLIQLNQMTQPQELDANAIEGIEQQLLQRIMSEGSSVSALIWQHSLKDMENTIGGREELIAMTTDFLVLDRIDPTKFLSNLAYLLNLGMSEALDEYKENKNFDPTPSIKEFPDLGDRPRAYPSWFLAAYPDVVSWTIERIREDESAYKKLLLSAVGNEPIERGELDEKHLRIVIDLYLRETEDTLECRRSAQ